MASCKDICFSVLKYILVIISVISSVGIVLILFGMSSLISASEIESIETKYGLAIFYVFFIVNLIFCILGIIGLVKEHFGLTLAFAIFGTVNIILLLSIGWYRGFKVLFDVLFIICAYTYAGMIKSRGKSQMPSAPAMV